MIKNNDTFIRFFLILAENAFVTPIQHIKKSSCQYVNTTFALWNTWLKVNKKWYRDAQFFVKRINNCMTAEKEFVHNFFN